MSKITVFNIKEEEDGIMARGAIHAVGLHHAHINVGLWREELLPDRLTEK